MDTLSSTVYPDNPYIYTNYDEDYRGQYHFSSQSGWMNDINGLWHYNGIYHLTYQNNPHGVTANYPADPMHWGHATSTDLIHWVQQPVILEPGVNVPGDCWSGSTVVDTDNDSGLKTGFNPVLVTLYTATKEGTCIAYSNDLGTTWQGYPGNPVLAGDTFPRDPRIFWHEKTGKWIMVLFQGSSYASGVTFYTSTDLKNWIFASNFDWGVIECPDMYELAVDGNQKNKKWVLQSALGGYYIGSFDGRTFTPDPGGPYCMDVGPDFYASSTFYRGTFPDNRVVQIAWLGRGTGIETPVFRKGATFPVELQLKTYPEGIRLARTPISEIAGIYGTVRHWDTQAIAPGGVLLSEIRSKCFDISAEFDVSGTNATHISFNIANKTVSYDISGRTLLDNPLNPLHNRIKIRMLVDWGQLEVFGNDGFLSWSESFGFTPDDDTLSLTTDGNITLVSMDYRNINRVWPS